MTPASSSASTALPFCKRTSLRINPKTLRIPVSGSSCHIDLHLSASNPKCLFKTSWKMRIPKTLTVSYCFSFLYSSPSRCPQFPDLGFCSSRRFFTTKRSQGVCESISGEFTLKDLSIYRVALCSFIVH